MLIVLELDVVAGRMLVGEVGFEDQSLDLVIGDDPFQVLGHRPQQGRSQMISLARAGVEVAAHAIAQVHRLADIDDFALGILHQVDAGARGQGLQLGLEGGGNVTGRI